MVGRYQQLARPLLVDGYDARLFTEIHRNAYRTAVHHQPALLFVVMDRNPIEVSVAQFGSAGAQADEPAIPLQDAVVRLAHRPAPPLILPLVSKGLRRPSSII